MFKLNLDEVGSVISSGFAFPEGLRFHEGRLWFSDMHVGDVYSMDPDTGATTFELTVNDQTSGMGWLPNGDMLLSLMFSRKIMRVSGDGKRTVHADLSRIEATPTNEMLVDSNGHAYLGSFGYDIYAGEAMTPAPVYHINAEGEVLDTADAFDFPNGTVMIPGTRTLVIAHSFRPELTAFDLDESGAFTNRRTWALLPEGTTADGLGVDSQGGIWVSSLLTSEFLRVVQGGEVTHCIETPGRLAVDAVVDDRDDTVVYFSTSNSREPHETKGRSGAIERVTLQAL